MGVPTTHGDELRDEIVAFMRQYEDTHPYPATVAEITEALDVQRTSVLWHLQLLRREGRVDYIDGKLARSLRLAEHTQ